MTTFQILLANYIDRQMMAKQPQNATKTKAPRKPTVNRPQTSAIPTVPPEVDKRLDRLEDYIATIAEPISKRNDPNRSRWARIADALETHTASRILIGLGAVLALASVVGVGITAMGVWYQYQSMQEERVARAWAALASKPSGNSGKGDAIEYLHGKGEYLIGLDLSGPSEGAISYIDGLKLKNGRLTQMKAINSIFNNVQFEGVELKQANARFSKVNGEFDWVEIEKSDFSNSEFDINQGRYIYMNYSLFDNSTFFLKKIFNIDEQKELKNNPDYEILYAKHMNNNSNWFKSEAKFKNDISFENSSLRCARIFIPPHTNFSLTGTNVSGAEFYVLPEEGAAQIPSRVSEIVWKLNDKVWYYSDNPPKYIDSKFLDKYFISVEREKVHDVCRKKSWFSIYNFNSPNLEASDDLFVECTSILNNENVCIGDSFESFGNIFEELGPSFEKSTE